MRSAVTVPTPVWPNLPTSSAFVPLVFLVAAIAAGFFAWAGVGLSPTKAAWGLAALDVLQLGQWQDRLALETPAPLYAWSLAVALKLPLGSVFWRLTLPNFIFALLALLLLYRVARRWYSPGTGLVACFFFAINHAVLLDIRHGGPETCTLFTVLLLLWCYLRHEQTQEVLSVWLVASCGCVTLLVLTAGAFVGWMFLLAVTMFLYVHLHRRRNIGGALVDVFRSRTMWTGLGALALGTLLALPWLEAGRGDLAADHLTAPSPGIGSLLQAMPATFVLACFGFWHVARQCIRGGPETAPAAMLTMWSLIGFLAVENSSAQRAVPFAMIPLTLLAARSFIAMLNRKLHDRQVLLLAIATAWVFVLTQAPSADILPLMFKSDVKLTAEQKLDLHYTFDVMLVMAVVATGLYTLSAKHDRYRRQFVGAFTVLVLVGSAIPALSLLKQLNDESDIWKRTHAGLSNFQSKQQIIIVGSDKESMQMRFLVRELFPRASIERVSALSQVEEVVHPPISNVLVLVESPTSQLPTSTPIGQGKSQAVLAKVFSNEVVAAFSSGG